MNHWLRGNTMQPSSGGAFLERLRAARSNIKPSDLWTAHLRNIRGQVGHDGLERISTEAVYEYWVFPGSSVRQTPVVASEWISVGVGVRLRCELARSLRGEEPHGCGVMHECGCPSKLDIPLPNHNTI